MIALLDFFVSLQEVREELNEVTSSQVNELTSKRVDKLTSSPIYNLRKCY